MCGVVPFVSAKGTESRPGPLMLSSGGSGPGPPQHKPPHNSALSFSQLKLPELCASLELQAAASATGGAAFRSSRGRLISPLSSCFALGEIARIRVTLCTKVCCSGCIVGLHCRGELCSPATLHLLPTVHMCGVRAIADRPYRCAGKQLGVKATFHLISRLKATASPQGEAMARGHAKAFPLRGRWPKAG